MSSRKLILDTFFYLSDEEKEEGYLATHDSKLLEELFMKENNQAVLIAINPKFQEVYELWIDCEKDEILTRLSF